MADIVVWDIATDVLVPHCSFVFCVPNDIFISSNDIHICILAFIDKHDTKIIVHNVKFNFVH